MTIASKHLFAINSCSPDSSNKIQRALDESVEAKGTKEDDTIHLYLKFKDESYLSIRTSDGTASEWDSKPFIF